MADRSIILVGNPDSGKSNFLARLWLALQTQKFELMAANPPVDIKYVEDIAAHILQGRFVPRTDQEDNQREFNVEISSTKGENKGTLFIPDVSGEMWQKAVSSLEISQKWMDILRQSNGALLFVRVLSDLNIQPLDWVNCQKLLSAGYGDEDKRASLPTQISLIELTRFLENNLKSINDAKPKLAIVVSAWDLLNKEDANKGPQSYLATQFPMFAGRIKDTSKLEVKVFGLSIVGGNLSAETFMNSFLEKDIDTEGYIVTWDEKDGLQEIKDITNPISWLLK